jgi:predicted branched-subunit amino acid permease
MNIPTSLLIFGANVLTDVLAVLFIQSVTKCHRLRAGIVSVAIVALSYYSIYYVVQDIWYIIPTMAGCFVGTVITVRKGK